MKTKVKQKRGEPIESITAFTVNEISKRDLGWIVRVSNNGARPESSIQISHEFKEQVFIQIPKSDFDRLQPGDQIRFLAVVTRPRKVKQKEPEVIEDQFTIDKESAIATEVSG